MIEVHPAHDPKERVLMMTLDPWQVRVFEGNKQDYFLTHGFAHLQLWHPQRRISILTPSRLTQWLYEVYPVAGTKASTTDLKHLAMMVSGAFGIELPDRHRLLELEHSLVFEMRRAHEGIAS